MLSLGCLHCWSFLSICCTGFKHALFRSLLCCKSSRTKDDDDKLTQYTTASTTETASATSAAAASSSDDAASSTTTDGDGVRQWQSSRIQTQPVAVSSSSITSASGVHTFTTTNTVNGCEGQCLRLPGTSFLIFFAISRSRCQCVMGNYKCHHVAAALLYG